MKNKVFFTAILAILVLAIGNVGAQTSGFTYQGRFTDSTVAQPTSGTYQMEFALFDAVSGGTQIGTTVTNSTVQVTNGIFTVNLDFGANSFDGAGRFLEIRVFNPTTSAFVNLSPRQAITNAPYAIRALNATTADNALNLGNVAANQFIREGDLRLTDSRTASSIDFNAAQLNGVVPIANGGTGSATRNFVDLSTTQSGIAGNKTFTGTVSGNTVNAATQYNIGGSRVFSAPVFNTFAGAGTGSSNTSGFSNSFFGREAGRNNTSGNFNSFFGARAGSGNTTGDSNTLIGYGTDVNSANLQHATAIGANASVSISFSLVLGTTSPGTNIGIGTDSPLSRLHLVHSSIQWGIRIGNPETGFNTGMRVANSGFFEVTNNLTASSPNFARLDTGGNWTAVSDVRLKQDIFPLSGLLDKMLALRAVNYRFKNDPTVSQIGFIAQEVEAIFPEFVSGANREDEMITLNYSGLSVVAIGAIQEQQTQIDEQKKTIKTQTEKLEQQQTEVDAMEQFICSQTPTAPFCKKEE